MKVMYAAMMAAVATAARGDAVSLTLGGIQNSVVGNETAVFGGKANTASGVQTSVLGGL